MNRVDLGLFKNLKCQVLHRFGLVYLGVDDWYHYFSDKDGVLHYMTTEFSESFSNIGNPFDADFDGYAEAVARAREFGVEQLAVLRHVLRRGVGSLQEQDYGDLDKMECLDQMVRSSFDQVYA